MCASWQRCSGARRPDNMSGRRPGCRDSHRIGNSSDTAPGSGIWSAPRTVLRQRSWPGCRTEEAAHERSHRPPDPHRTCRARRGNGEPGSRGAARPACLRRCCARDPCFQPGRADQPAGQCRGQAGRGSVCDRVRPDPDGRAAPTITEPPAELRRAPACGRVEIPAAAGVLCSRPAGPAVPTLWPCRLSSRHTASPESP
jgi:hypothetical protein